MGSTLSVRVCLGRRLISLDSNTRMLLGYDSGSCNNITHTRMGGERTSIVLVDLASDLVDGACDFVGRCFIRKYICNNDGVM